jgi:tRNA(fMet)-specific endonuclease VapC
MVPRGRGLCSPESSCRSKHQPALIGPLDLMIAAHAVAVRATLVTNDTRELARVQGLRVADWTK